MEVNPNDFKVFNDPVHGHIELPNLCVKLLDTPEFQRLRDIKKLGGCYWVFPGASHNMFEHAIGICHLGGKYLSEISRRQKSLGITEFDILCVEVAGLGYNLGRGPFNYVYSELITKWNGGSEYDSNYKSEQMSWIILENVLDKLMDEQLIEMKDFHLGDKVVCDGKLEEMLKDLKSVVKEIILGPANTTSIIRNRRSKIDAITMDSFARDCYHLGLADKFDHERLMKFARVIEVKGVNQICHRDKEAVDLYELFHRYKALYTRSTQHKTVKIIEYMLAEAIVKAKDLIITSRNGQACHLGDIWRPENVSCFVAVTDSVIHRIHYSQEPEFAESRAIIDKIVHRKIYRIVGTTPPESEGAYHTLGSLKQDLLIEMMKKLNLNEEDLGELKKEDLIIHVVRSNYGQEEGDQSNPVDREAFYTKERFNETTKIQREKVSHMISRNYSEFIIRVYCKSQNHEVFGRAKEIFDAWIKGENV